MTTHSNQLVRRRDIRVITHALRSYGGGQVAHQWQESNGPYRIPDLVRRFVEGSRNTINYIF